MIDLWEYVTATRVVWLSLMVFAFLMWKPSGAIVLVMCANFVGSMAFGLHYHFMIVLDVLCAWILVGRGRMENKMALVYGIMGFVYLPAIIGGWSVNTTYGIIEVLGLVQIAIIGGLGGGYISRRMASFWTYYRFPSVLCAISQGRDSAQTRAVADRKEAVVKVK